MKTLGLRMLALFLLMVGAMAARGQERDAEVPGDNFSLEGALELFKKSESPEQFEKMLNAQDSKVNNLDLNGDGYIDYIRVIDRNEGNIHTFTMQAVISDSEVQDVAVITLEKLVNGKAVLQIIGDEDVYGMETIIEPTREVRVNAGTTTTQEVVDVWAWPSVQYVYSPSYVVWISPWSWSVRPIWWSHWHPVVYYHYDSYWRPYRPYYTQCYSPRIVYASRIYRPYRSTSVIVHRRHETQITRYRSTHRDTYERNRSGSTSNPRYSNNPERKRQGVSADRPTVRTQSHDGDNVTRTREEVRNTRPTESNKTERNATWNDNRVQRERSDNETSTRKEVRDTRPTERNANWSERPVQRERSESDAITRERSVEQPQRERNAERNAERSFSEQRERSNSTERQRPTVQPRQEQPKREQPQRERASTQSRSSEPRVSSPERSGRSSGKSDSGSSQSQGRKRSR